MLKYPFFTVDARQDNWATSYHVVPDPEATQSDLERLNVCLISANFPKIPYSIWCRVANLFKYYSDKSLGTLEAAVGFFYNWDTAVWKCLVPKQSVTGVSVNYDFKKACDIETGEEISCDDLLAEGYVWMSRTHSHNTMNLPTPSATDDTTEIPVSQFCGIVSNINTAENSYMLTFTVVRTWDEHRKINRRYFNIPRLMNLHWTKFVESPWEIPADVYPFTLPFDDEFQYHENCLKYVVKHEYQTTIWTGSSRNVKYFTGTKSLPAAGNTPKDKGRAIYLQKHGRQELRNLVKDLLNHTNMGLLEMWEILAEFDVEQMSDPFYVKD